MARSWRRAFESAGSPAPRGPHAVAPAHSEIKMSSRGDMREGQHATDRRRRARDGAAIDGMHGVVPVAASSNSDPLWRAVDAALDRLAIDRDAPVLAACSGGADSVALAHAAIALARAGRLGSVTLCHVDHQLRDGSAAEGALVRRLAAQCGAAFVGVAVDVDRRTGSLEAAARDARYAALEKVAADRCAPTILVAHT